MARKQSPAAPPPETVTFEEAYANLENIVRLLEEGQLGLSESLDRYEEGVKQLKHCHEALQRAERKIQLLTGVDEQGNPLTEPFDDAVQTLEQKQEARTRRRSRSPRVRTSPPEGEGGLDIDSQKGLF